MSIFASTKFFESMLAHSARVYICSTSRLVHLTCTSRSTPPTPLLPTRPTASLPSPIQCSGTDVYVYVRHAAQPSQCVSDRNRHAAQPSQCVCDRNRHAAQPSQCICDRNRHSAQPSQCVCDRDRHSAQPSQCVRDRYILLNHHSLSQCSALCRQ